LALADTWLVRMDSEIAHFDENLVRGLISSQFPNWSGLFLEAIEPQGHDNRTFRLGNDKSVRLPSGPAYASHVVVEYRWLSELAPHLPVQIPEPLALGRPDQDFPWHWLVNRWLGGNDAATARVKDMVCFASDLAAFLKALQGVDAAGASKPNADNFFRGGHLSAYDSDTIDCIGRLEGKIDAKAATETWSHALESEWNAPPVWVHGDIAASNLLVQDGRLSGVIDFGQLAAGDPACDLAIAWTSLTGKSRHAFREQLGLDRETWIRGRGWALWKALVMLDAHREHDARGASPARVIREIVADDD
jgi:aminoglycoside phosphotransferase (APT) family kinase protein